MNTILKTTVLIGAMLLGSAAMPRAAFAFGDIVIAPPAKEQPDRGNGADHPFPYDSGRMNESPIRGNGAFKVVHNKPLPGDPDDEVAKAIRILKDHGWQFGKGGWHQ